MYQADRQGARTSKAAEGREVREPLHCGGRDGQQAQEGRAQQAHARERARHVLGGRAAGPHRWNGGACASQPRHQGAVAMSISDMHSIL